MSNSIDDIINEAFVAMQKENDLIHDHMQVEINRLNKLVQLNNELISAHKKAFDDECQTNEAKIKKLSRSGCVLS